MKKKPKQAARGRGRPKVEDGLTERMLIRFDKAQKAALSEYADRGGFGADSTAVRMIVVEKLRKEGLL